MLPEKIAVSTQESHAPGAVSSRSPCPLGKVLDLVGDRWSLLVIRDLMFKGFHEFGEFLTSGEGIASNILSDRLKRLSRNGFIASARHPTDGKKKVYYLTEEGKSLLPVMIELTLWGVEHTPDSAVPTEILDGMRHAREEFSSAVLERIKNWENEHLRRA